MKDSNSGFYTFKRSISSFVLLTLLTACEQKLKEQSEENILAKQSSSEDVLSYPDQKNDLTLKHELIKEDEDTIRQPCAILISPSQKTIETLGEAYHIFGGMNSANLNLIESYLDSIGIKKTFELSEGIIYFLSQENKIFNLDLSEFDWGFVLFNGQEPPKKMDMDDMLESDSSFYEIYHFNMIVADSLK